MAKRRRTKNVSGIPKIPGLPVHEAWASYTCLQCGQRNYEQIGKKLLSAGEAYETCAWKCCCCDYLHHKDADLPFDTWPKTRKSKTTLPAQRFWKAFFRGVTESPESYWKICNTCGRTLPNVDFSHHADWGPLEKQMECRACKGAINAVGNPVRTDEQLRESANKRRIAELLVSQIDQKLDVDALFERFEGKCFKTGAVIDRAKSKTWQIDHTIPSKFFYPLTVTNATLLSTDANLKKGTQWPEEFYTNRQLKKLARITGASLELLARKEPVYNQDIDVNACVDRFLNVRNASGLSKRIKELKTLLEKHELLNKLSDANKALLGIE